MKRVRKQRPWRWVQEGVETSVNSSMVVVCTCWGSEHDTQIWYFDMVEATKKRRLEKAEK